MAQNVDLEIKVIKRFINQAKQNRYIQFVSSPKNRHKFIRDLSHFNFLKQDLFNDVKGIEEEVILEALRKHGVPDKTCYVISENSRIDTKTMDTKEAISETVGYGMGTILVFGNADIIFYECETMNVRFISKNVT
ncbi:MAG TPA: hypothetical protein VFT15_19275 [Chitinophagaceae bacterium]|nr:hypothetical protein [Chitinophagaceae bacterium]